MGFANSRARGVREKVQTHGLKLPVTCIHPAELRRERIKGEAVGQAQVVLC